MRPSERGRTTLAYLALGSNLGDRVGHLESARDAIAAIPGCSLERFSSLYETAAWGSDSPQPDYLNAVMRVATTLTAHELWRQTAAIEQLHGRSRSDDRNAARTLDIDLLLFDDMILHTADLVVPHPRMHLRKFVLLPLLEIAPDIEIPGLGAAARLLTLLSDQQAHKRGDNSAWR
jgi:2-amino-4-hydroxy-6-hydroxymethyldihydropteridine diphosphokinase